MLNYLPLQGITAGRLTAALLEMPFEPYRYNLNYQTLHTPFGKLGVVVNRAQSLTNNFWLRRETLTHAALIVVVKFQQPGGECIGWCQSKVCLQYPAIKYGTGSSIAVPSIVLRPIEQLQKKLQQYLLDNGVS